MLSQLIRKYFSFALGSPPFYRASAPTADKGSENACPELSHFLPAVPFYHVHQIVGDSVFQSHDYIQVSKPDIGVNHDYLYDSASPALCRYSLWPLSCRLRPCRMSLRLLHSYSYPPKPAAFPRRLNHFRKIIARCLMHFLTPRKCHLQVSLEICFT